VVVCLDKLTLKSMFKTMVRFPKFVTWFSSIILRNCIFFVSSGKFCLYCTYMAKKGDL